MKKEKKNSVTPLYPRITTCTRVAFGQSYHCLLGKPHLSLVGRPLSLSFLGYPVFFSFASLCHNSTMHVSFQAEENSIGAHTPRKNAAFVRPITNLGKRTYVHNKVISSSMRFSGWLDGGRALFASGFA